MKWTDRIGRSLKLNGLHILMIVAESGSMGKAAGGGEREVLCRYRPARTFDWALPDEPVKGDHCR
jgi:hypothetical protein